MAETSTLEPPRPERRTTRRTVHDVELVDDYGWMRDRDDPAVLEHLKAENAFTEGVLARTGDLRTHLYDEMLSRVQEDDESAPLEWGGYRYWSRQERGKQYRIHLRRPVDGATTEQVLIDGNALAEGRDYYRLGAFAVAPAHDRLAWSADFDGSERFVLKVRDLERDADLDETIENTSPGVAWSADGSDLYYVVLDETRRPYEVRRHTIGTPVADDAVVYREDDPAFYVGIGATRDRALVVIEASSNDTSEAHVVDAHDLAARPRRVWPRRKGVEYDVDHRDGTLWIVTNDGAVNFRLVTVPLDDPARERATEILPARDDVKLDAVDLFRDHYVVWERRDGLKTLRIRTYGTDDERAIPFPEPAYALYRESNPDFAASAFRVEYTSLVTPPTVLSIDVATLVPTVLKRLPVPGGYDPEGYVTERVFATAGDGVRVPISLVRRRDAPADGSAALLLDAYGSYGISREPGFVSSRLSLLDRGVTYALAHVRGGGEMGRPWYDAGKLAHKATTFSDVVACAEHLVAERYADPARLALTGGSAGGLMVGAVINLRPELFRAAIAHVPFVDVVNTMLDPSLPLTVIEYDEWGNPNEREAFETIRAYSPYDNVDALAYPTLFVTSGLNDPRVSYWEPTKWVAKVRHVGAPRGPVLLKTFLGAGHGGSSGRYDALRDRADEYAFVLASLGAVEDTIEGADG